MTCFLVQVLELETAQQTLYLRNYLLRADVSEVPGSGLASGLLSARLQLPGARPHPCHGPVPGVPQRRCRGRARPAAACRPRLLLLLRLPVTLICVSHHTAVHRLAPKRLSTAPHLRPKPHHRSCLRTGPDARQLREGRRAGRGRPGVRRLGSGRGTRTKEEGAEPGPLCPGPA